MWPKLFLGLSGCLQFFLDLSSGCPQALSWFIKMSPDPFLIYQGVSNFLLIYQGVSKPCLDLSGCFQTFSWIIRESPIVSWFIRGPQALFWFIRVFPNSFVIYQGVSKPSLDLSGRLKTIYWFLRMSTSPFSIYQGVPILFWFIRMPRNSLVIYQAVPKFLCDLSGCLQTISRFIRSVHKPSFLIYQGCNQSSFDLSGLPPIFSWLIRVSPNFLLIYQGVLKFSLNWSTLSAN